MSGPIYPFGCEPSSEISTDSQFGANKFEINPRSGRPKRDNEQVQGLVCNHLKNSFVCFGFLKDSLYYYSYSYSGKTTSELENFGPFVDNFIFTIGICGDFVVQ